MKKFLSALATLALAIGLGTAGAVSAQAAPDPFVGVVGTLLPWSSATNQASYWTTYGTHTPSNCVAGNATYGTLTDGDKTVTLNAFVDAWPGDHFELLVVKGGSVSNNVVVHPTAGVKYASPLNDGDKQSTVSHWFVCFGTTPPPPPEPLVPEYGKTDQTCVSGSLVGGTITATLNAAITFSLKDSSNTPIDILSGVASGLAPNATYYISAVDANPADGFVVTEVINAALVIGPHVGVCAIITIPTPVSVTATPQRELCDTESGQLTLGSILVGIAPSGGATVEYRKQGALPWLPLVANPITGLVGGTYEFKVTAATGHTLTTSATFDVVVPPDTAEACDEVVPINVAVTGTPTGEVCVTESGLLTLGSILVGIAPSGGATVEYRKQGALPWLPLVANPITGLVGGTYEFKVTPATGHTLTTPAAFTVKIDSDNNSACKKVTICHWNEGAQGGLGSYNEIEVSALSIVNPNGHATHAFDIIPPFVHEGGLVYSGKNYELGAEGCEGFDPPTLGLVSPQAAKDPGCGLPSFYTIGNSGSDPAALAWTANGKPIAEGKHVVNGPITVTLVAAPSGPEHGLELGAQTLWTFSFVADETCGDLKTLALTGAGDTTAPALALSAMLGLLGASLVRSAARVRRMNQEA